MKMYQPQAKGHVGVVAAAILSWAGISCGDEEPEVDVGDGRYAISIQMTSPDLSELSTFIGFADDLDSGELDLGDAIELGGPGTLWGVDGAGEFYVVRAEDLSVSKFRGEDGQLREVARVGLAGVGITQLYGEHMYFDGLDRGYLFELFSRQAVELDLEAMEIVRTHDISALLDPEQPTFLSFDHVRRGSEVVTVTYGSNIEQEIVSDLSQIVFFDTSTGELDLRTAPCGGLAYVMEAENGDLYFSSDPWTAGVHALYESRAPEPCLARVPAGSREPDSEVVRLNALTNGPTGGMVPAGASSMLLRVLDTTAFPLTQDLTAMQLFGLRGWTTWELDLSAPEAARPVQRDNLATGGITFLRVDGVVYENQSVDSFSETTLLRTTGPGSPASALRTPGVPFNIVKLR